MKRLMFDYFRRKWWILASGALLQFVIGLTVVDSVNKNGLSPASAFEFQIALFMGAFLLSFDLQRGIARTVAALPLTSRQIGRAWWLATVAIPAIALAALLFAGAATCCLHDPSKVFPTGWLTMSSVITLLWMGTGYVIIFNTTATGWHGSGWNRTRNILFAMVWGLMIGGGGWFLGVMAKSPVKSAIFFVIGVTLTALGWLRAEQFAVSRASFRLGTQTAGCKLAVAHKPGGYGGIPLLISHTFTPAFLMGLAMLAAFPLMMALQGNLKSWHQIVQSLTGMGFFPFWIIVFIVLSPAFMQLRGLRSLPISATRLAGVMLLLLVLPMLALSVAVTGLAGLTMGSPAALTTAQSQLLVFTPATLSVFFFAWQGTGTTSFLLTICVMIGAQTMPLWLQAIFHYREIPLGLAGAIALTFITLSFLLTRFALAHGSHAYRVQANPLGNVAWGGGR